MTTPDKAHLRETRFIVKKREKKVILKEEVVLLVITKGSVIKGLRKMNFVYQKLPKEHLENFAQKVAQKQTQRQKK